MRSAGAYTDPGSGMWGRILHPCSPPETPSHGPRRPHGPLPAGGLHRPPQRFGTRLHDERPGKKAPRRPTPLPAPPRAHTAARGDDEWVTISTESDAHWKALCEAMGRTDLLDEPRYRHILGPLQASGRNRRGNQRVDIRARCQGCYGPTPGRRCPVRYREQGQRPPRRTPTSKSATSSK